MLIDKAYQQFISGETFDSGLIFPVTIKNDAPKLSDRVSCLEQTCEGKRVLHIGCCDHFELIDIKRKDGVWLHDRIRAVASECVGVDINPEAVKYLRESLRIPSVYVADVTKGLPKIVLHDQHWDVVVLGEILEHLDSPVQFLERLHVLLSARADLIVLTCPNAMSRNLHRAGIKGFECVNSDHRYWFSPYTLAKVLFAGGFKPEEFFFVVSTMPPKAKGLMTYLRLRRLLRHPSSRDTILFKAKF